MQRGPLCKQKKMAEMGDGYYKALIAYYRLTRWHMYQDNPECVKKVINSDYWEAVDILKKEEDDDDDDNFGLYLFLGVAIGAVVVIAVLLLVIYLKRGKSDEEETTGNDPLKVTST